MQSSSPWFIAIIFVKSWWSRILWHRVCAGVGMAIWSLWSRCIADWSSSCVAPNSLCLLFLPKKVEADVGFYSFRMICKFCIFSVVDWFAVTMTAQWLDVTPYHAMWPSWEFLLLWNVELLMLCKCFIPFHCNVESLDVVWEYWPNWVGVHWRRASSSRVTHGLGSGWGTESKEPDPAEWVGICWTNPVMIMTMRMKTRMNWVSNFQIEMILIIILSTMQSTFLPGPWVLPSAQAVSKGKAKYMKIATLVQVDALKQLLHSRAFSAKGKAVFLCGFVNWWVRHSDYVDIFQHRLSE